MTAPGEIESLREVMQRQAKRLASAEDALLFYANPKSYAVQSANPLEAVFQNRVIDDFDKADARTHVAGKRARQHFQDYKTD